MNKIAVATDSNSGVTRAQASAWGIHVLPMPFIMDGVEYFEEITLSQEVFYQKMLAGTAITTSQPAVGAVLEFWDELLRGNDEIVYIPMSSGLSTACETAAMLARDYGGRVQVVDNRRISLPQKQSAMDAKTLADAGYDAVSIKNHLEITGGDNGIFIMVDTMKYLKKGGRVTPAGAAVGEILNIKPVLHIHGGKLDAYAKARGAKQARKTMIGAIQTEFNARFAGCAAPEHMWLQLAYTYDANAAADFKSEVEAAFPGFSIAMDPLSLSVACHIGPGALAVGCTKKLR